ncbi:VOC family protein [Thermogemmatispora carboxidivorans]|uniref:VOC family protein n=1 Tax=Thermogemmatispora carboxidivorans TaxID=1382306 RepID=UPI000699B7CA|nr:VOC family protein [Thermogemmatispora carboxidivorans]
MISGVWHFSFTVSNLERSLEWYTTVLGLEFVRGQVQQNEYTSRLVNFPNAHLKVAQLRIPGAGPTRSQHHLELVEYVWPQGQRLELATNNVGIAHLAFEVDDIHAAVARLQGMGVRFKSETPNAITEGVNKGGYSIYLLDPDGITLELVQPPPSS